jgi:hypothetical protein
MITGPEGPYLATPSPDFTWGKAGALFDTAPSAQGAHHGAA